MTTENFCKAILKDKEHLQADSNWLKMYFYGSTEGLNLNLKDVSPQFPNILSALLGAMLKDFVGLKKKP